jgi:hypothetical protein
MVTIPIHNETTYPLTDVMTLEILRDAHDHFGEEVHAIRVQSGLARHALNARTREVRYAFSPQDFGFGHTMPLVQEPPRARRRSPRRNEETEETEAAILPVPFEDVAMDAEDIEPLETSLESLDEGQDEEEADVFNLDNPLDNPGEEADEDDEDNLLDDEDDED